MTWGLADLVDSGDFELPPFVDVDVPALDLIVSTPQDALLATINGRRLRPSLTYAEQVRICRALALISPTVEIAQAIWKAAPIKQRPCELVSTPSQAQLMGTFAFLRAINDHIDESLLPGGWGRGAAKGWIIHPLMAEQGPRGACNYGFVHVDGHADQSPGGRHNDEHLDYSQLALDLCKRTARRISTGEDVDLLDVYIARYPQLAGRLALEYGT